LILGKCELKIPLLDLHIKSLPDGESRGRRLRACYVGVRMM
jgi:hypothetical protein